MSGRRVREAGESGVDGVSSIAPQNACRGAKVAACTEGEVDPLLKRWTQRWTVYSRILFRLTF